MQVAQTILQQLGGRRFMAMTGARAMAAHKDGLSFKLPSNFARHGINYVKITLTDIGWNLAAFESWSTVRFTRRNGESTLRTSK